MEIFKSTSLFKFQEKFKTNENCKEYLYHFKWKDGFKCSCGHTEAWKGAKPFTKVCKKCRKIHSSTSGTIFHNIKFDLRKAFYIVFEIATTTKSVSCLQIAAKYDIAKNTAWLFMRKYRQSLKSSENHPIDNNDGSVIYVDEFVVGGYEKGQTGRSNKSKKRKMLMVVEATTKNKIKRVYGLKIQNYGGLELKQIFDKFIAKGSTVITDGWRGYNLMKKDYNIVEEIDKMKKNNNPMNRMNQQFKSWLRGVHHKSTHQHIEAYLNEFCFRINRSQWKETRFHSAILKGLSHEPYPKNMIPDVHCYV